MKITLPWPPKELSPNARKHWAAKAKAAKKYRHEAFVITRQAGIVINWPGDIHLWIKFYPPDRRRRDDDNITIKNARDGIADALGVDDRRFRAHPFLSDEVRPGGEVEIRFTAGPEEVIS
jgi:Holliday junction resolvase RusA-like endonuclease